ncbi:hypothetical protein SprV_0200938700 [Sparganum proliferum]
MPSRENFGLIELECVDGSRRMGRDLRVGVISPYRCDVLGDSRPEQSSSFSDVVALSATAPDPDLAVETAELLLRSKYNETENRLGDAQVLQLLKFCLKTYFTFDGTICEQVK